MPIPFTCPHCGAETLVEEQYFGQRGKCYICDKPVVIPRPAGFQPSDPATVAPDIVQQHPQQKQSTSPVFIVTIVIGLVALLIVAGMMVASLSPMYWEARGRAENNACEANLKKISLAMQQYQLEEGTYPPAYIPDANGKPMHSWRVLLLPYLNEHALYQQYDFSIPWDDPRNQILLLQMPEVYGCTTDPDAEDLGETSYLVLVGAKTMFPGSKGRKIDEATDGPSKTLLVVEAHGLVINWLEPKDLSVKQMSFVINASGDDEIGSHHLGGAHGVSVTGKTYFLPEEMAPEDLEALSTVNGGESFQFEDLTVD